MTGILAIDGHVVVTPLAGRASLTVRQHGTDGFGPFCRPILSVVLEPDQVLELATELTQAAIPPPPVVKRRIEVRQDDEDRTWRFECPECFPVEGRWHDQPDALAAAYAHLAAEHASEVSR